MFGARVCVGEQGESEIGFYAVTFYILVGKATPYGFSPKPRGLGGLVKYHLDVLD